MMAVESSQPESANTTFSFIVILSFLNDSDWFVSDRLLIYNIWQRNASDFLCKTENKYAFKTIGYAKKSNMHMDEIGCKIAGTYRKHKEYCEKCSGCGKWCIKSVSIIQLCINIHKIAKKYRKRLCFCVIYISIDLFQRKC